jgi:MoxR-like ATPase
MKKQTNNLVSESLDEFVGVQLNEGLFTKAKSKLSQIKSTIQKVGKYYLAKFKDFVLAVGLPINIGLMFKNKQLGAYDYYVPSASDKKMEPSLASFGPEGLLKSRKNLAIKEDAEFNAKFPTPESYFEFLSSKGLMESKITKHSTRAKLLEHIDDMKNVDDEIPNVNMDELGDMIHEALMFPDAATPLMIWGAPGIGKTSIINSVLDARKQDGRLIFVDIQYTTPESWFMPYLQQDDTVEGGRKYVDLPKNKLPLYKPAHRTDPDKAEKDRVANEKANEGGGGIIFFDEICRGTEEVLGTCLSLMAGRKIEEYVLGDKWSVICASNRKEDMTNPEVIKYDRVLGNRFNHVNFVPLYSEWKVWAKKAGINEYVLRFLDHKFEDFWYDARRSEDVERTVFASPRSWTAVSTGLTNMAAAMKDLGKPFTRAKQAMTIARAVGGPIAEQLMAFMHITDKYPQAQIAKIWTDPAHGPKLEKGGRSGDALSLTEVTAITLIAIEMKKGEKQIDPKEFANFCKWVVMINHPAAAGFAVRMLVEDYCPYMHPELGDYKPELTKYKEGGDILRKAYGVLWGAKAETA